MTPERRGILLTLCASAAAAVFLTTYKLASVYGDPADAVLLLLVSAAFWNSLARAVQARRLRIEQPDRFSLKFAALVAVLTLTGNYCASAALVRISAPLTSVFQQTQVLFVALLGAPLLGERVNARFWLGALVATAGVGVLRLAPDDVQAVSTSGSLLAVGSAASFGAMALLTRKYIHRIKPIAVNALRLWMSVPLWFVFERRMPDVHAWSWSFIALCATAAALGPTLARLLLMYALKYIPANRTTLVGLSTPALALIPTAIAFGTLPSTRELLGGAIMIAGIALPLLAPATKPVPAVAADAP